MSFLLLQSSSPGGLGFLPLVIAALVVAAVVLVLRARQSAGPSQTFQLLDQEGVLADLRRGTLQKLTSDIFLKKTVILTNKRLVLVHNRLGSFSKQYIFLKDVQGLSSQRFLNLWTLILAAALGAMSVLAFATNRLAPAAICAVLAAIFALYVKENRIRISTMTDNIFFDLERGFDLSRADKFVDLVQVEMDRLKKG
jgi:hypothetical protein